MLAYITWDVSPEIFQLGPLTLKWYGLLFASGFLIGLYIVRRMFAAEKVPEAWLDTCFVYMVVATIIGARLGHVLFYDWDYYSQNLSEIPMVWKGGLASHGGAMAIIFALWLFSKRVSKKSVLWILDKVVVPTALAGCFIRLGNLMNSEIIGLPTEVSWAFIFTSVDDVPRHPVQIYEAFTYLLSFGILYYTYWKTDKVMKPGYIFGFFLVLIWGFRFIMEYVKESQGGFETLVNEVLTTGQLLSIPFFIIGLYFMFRPSSPSKDIKELPSLSLAKSKA
ncbi:MAG: prolipoprotein diacylglyceryl transferase [Bacteroidota bacterium]